MRKLAITTTLLLSLTGCAIGTQSASAPSPGLAIGPAVGEFEALHEANPTDVKIAMALARAYRYDGRSQDAIDVLQTLDPDALTLAEMGKARLALGDAARAVEALTDSLSLDSENWQAHSALGIAFDHLRAYREAQGAYRTALEYCPDNAAVLNNMAISAAMGGNVDKGIILLEQAARLGRHMDIIQGNLTVFAQALDACPNCATVWLRDRGIGVFGPSVRVSDDDAACARPEAETPEMVSQLEALPSIDIRVHFEFGSDVLRPEAEAILDTLGEALTSSQLKDYRFEIAGHTDAVGTDAYNADLSERRAQSVRAYLLTAFQILPERLVTVGYGESRLSNPGTPKSAENRRVQVTRLGRLN